MPPKVISQKNFVKGVVAAFNRFSIPKGAVLKASNLLLTERGALQTCDGTGLQATLAAAPGTNGFVELGMFVSSTFVTTKLALLPVDATHLRVYSWIGTGDTPAAITGPGTDLPLTSGWILPQIINFAGQAIITLGNGQTPQATGDAATFAKLTANTSGSWIQDHLYSIGDRISAAGNAYQVTSLTITSINSQGAIGNQGGYSGHTTPDFMAADTAGVTHADNQIIWMCIRANVAGLAQQSVPAGAAFGISHAAALWLWNTAPVNTDPNAGTPPAGVADGPSIIRASSPNNVGGWPNANVAFVGKDDGTQGTGIAVFTIAEAGISPTGSLVLFKDYTTYQIIGVFGAANFAITQVKTDMGCSAGATVQFATGFGIVRFCHLGFALFDGVNDRLISEEIRPYIFGRADITGVDFTKVASQGRACLTANPPMYACMLPTSDSKRYRVFCYDLVMRAWMIVDFNNAIASHPVTTMKQLRVPFQSAQALGPTTYIADLDVSGAANIHRWQQGDLTWQDAGAVKWSVTPPEVGEPGSRAYFRRAMIRLHAAATGTITGAFNFASIAQPSNAQINASAGPSSGTAPNLTSAATYEGEKDLGVSLDIGQTAPSANGTFSGTGKVTIEGIDWHVVGKQPRPFGQAA